MCYIYLMDGQADSTTSFGPQAGVSDDQINAGTGGDYVEVSNAHRSTSNRLALLSKKDRLLKCSTAKADTGLRQANAHFVPQSGPQASSDEMSVSYASCLDFMNPYRSRMT